MKSGNFSDGTIYLDDGQFRAFGHDCAEILSSISSKNDHRHSDCSIP